MKECPHCGEVLPLESFSRDARGAQGRARLCRSCRSAYRRGPAGDGERKRDNEKRRQQYANDPTYRQTVKDRNRRGRFGVTSEWIERQLEVQGGGCAICGTKDPVGRGWHIDHDHSCCPGVKTCGRCVRGVLCMNCNFAIGHMKDDPALFEAAIRYLQMFAGMSGSGQPVLQGGVSRYTPARG